MSSSPFRPQGVCIFKTKGIGFIYLSVSVARSTNFISFRRNAAQSIVTRVSIFSGNTDGTLMEPFFFFKFSRGVFQNELPKNCCIIPIKTVGVEYDFSDEIKNALQNWRNEFDREFQTVVTSITSFRKIKIRSLTNPQPARTQNCISVVVRGGRINTTRLHFVSAIRYRGFQSRRFRHFRGKRESRSHGSSPSPLPLDACVILENNQI